MAGPAAAQETGTEDDVRVVPAPQQARVSGEQELVLGTVEGEQLAPSAIQQGVIEGWDVVLRREAERKPSEGIRRQRDGRQGRWQVPKLKYLRNAHSGSLYAVNEWGDARMGIGFGKSVDLSGAWFTSHRSGDQGAQGLRAIGFKDGVEVARTVWFRDVDESPSFFAMNLSGIDRVVIEAEPFFGGAGCFGMDDLTYTPTGIAPEVIVDFEDISHRTVLTESGYAGLTWEMGTGEFVGQNMLDASGQAEQAAGQTSTTHGANGTFGANAGASGTIPPPTYGGAGTAPTHVQDFLGPQLGDAGANAIPPDTCGAVGIDHFVACVNSNISIYVKSTGNRVLNSSLGSFFGVGVGDPRVTFDPDSQRFIVLATTFSTTGNSIRVAVSRTSDPTGNWFKFGFSPSQGSDAGRWPDYPTLGVDARGIYTASYMVGSPARMTIHALDKAPLVAAAPSVGTISAFRNLSYERAIQPCVQWDDPGVCYFVSTPGGSPTSNLIIRRINGPLTNPTLTTQGSISTGINYNVPPSAPAMGASNNLDSLDGRLMNAVFRNGSIWTAHGVRSNDNRCVSRWYELNPANMTVVQRSTVNDADIDYLMPSIAVNSAGDALIGFTATSASMFASCWVAGRKAGDPLNEMSLPFAYKPGTTGYNLGGGNPQRWGDYSQTSADPVDDSLWTIQEFAGANEWRTRIAQYEFDQDDVVRYCTTTPNSGSAIGSVIDYMGSVSLAANDLVLTASGNPPNQFALFFYGTLQDNTPIGNGIKCVSGSQFRLAPAPIDGVGFVMSPVDYNNPPAAAGQIVSGSVWNFQCWLRDPAAGGSNFDFSDALQITFQP